MRGEGLGEGSARTQDVTLPPRVTPRVSGRRIGPFFDSSPWHSPPSDAILFPAAWAKKKMTEREKDEIAARLAARFGRAPAGEPVHAALERMVDAGASRFGVRADQPAAGFSACDLAPPLARMIDHTALKPETTV